MVVNPNLGQKSPQRRRHPIKCAHATHGEDKMVSKIVKSDLEIAQAAKMKHINEIAQGLGIDVDDL